ncbi:hypothetical protein AOQ84DRAFT_228330, partial [Glonium stellatum]
MNETPFTPIKVETESLVEDQANVPAEAESTTPTTPPPIHLVRAWRLKKPRKQRKPRQKLMKWDDDNLKLGLLALVYALKARGIEIPWAEAASIIDPLCSGPAFEQAVGKIRKKRLGEGKAVPPLPPASSGARADYIARHQTNYNWPAIPDDMRPEALALGQPSSRISHKRRSDHSQQNPRRASELDSELGVAEPSRKKFKPALFSSLNDEQSYDDTSDSDDSDESDAIVETTGPARLKDKSFLLKLPLGRDTLSRDTLSRDPLSLHDYLPTLRALPTFPPVSMMNTNTMWDGATGFEKFDSQVAASQFRTPPNRYPSALEASSFNIMPPDFGSSLDNLYRKPAEPSSGFTYPVPRPANPPKPTRNPFTGPGSRSRSRIVGFPFSTPAGGFPALDLPTGGAATGFPSLPAGFAPSATRPAVPSLRSPFQEGSRGEAAEPSV